MANKEFKIIKVKEENHPKKLHKGSICSDAIIYEKDRRLHITYGYADPRGVFNG